MDKEKGCDCDGGGSGSGGLGMEVGEEGNYIPIATLSPPE